MKAVIMAGGSGSRLRPLTIERPKPMVPIVNKPVMSHILDLVKRHNINEVIVTVQYLADMIQDFYGDGTSFGVRIHYSVEESPLGTAGSVKNAEHLLDDTFLVISGDALTNFDLTSLLEYHKQMNTLATLALYNISDPVDYGVITLNSSGQITRFQEKPSRRSVMSDYINTGIYVLEPETLSYFQHDTVFDFAKDLFPMLHERGYPLYGYVGKGYWCDVGTIPEYMRATEDALEGRVEGLDLGHEQSKGVWTGRDVTVAPDAHVEGPVYLGNAVQVKSGAVIRGPAVIRDYTVIDDKAQLERSILWRNCYIGAGARINGAIILRQCSVKTKATLYEGTVIGDGTIIGEGAVIHANVKIWPGKEVEPGATVNSSIIWGSQGRRVLFSRYGVTGVVNIDLTPEFSAKLGAAFAATLDKGTLVTINRDMHRSPRMIKRAIISGLPSAGVNVWDLGSQPIPVARYYTRVSGAQGGVHVRLSPFDERVVDIRFMDNHGLNLNQNRERDVERVFFREDFRRVYLNDIGSIEYAPRVKERYVEDFLKHLNTKTIQDAGFHLVVDFAGAPVASVLPIILDELRCDVIALNANTDKPAAYLNQSQFHTALKQMQIITTALGTQLGVRLDTGGEKIFIVDDRGFLLEGITACAAMVDMALRDAPGSAVTIPVNLPHIFEKIAQRYNGRVIRTEIDSDALIKATCTENVIMAGDDEGSFIFPDFQCAVDGLMALAKLLEFLATQKTSLSEVVSNLPHFYVAERRVSCSWESKARVMRLIHERFDSYRNQAPNGVKMELGPDRWVLITPDQEQPQFRVTTEGSSQGDAETLADEYAEVVKSMTPVE